MADALDWFIKYHNSTHWGDERYHWKPEYTRQLKPYRLKEPVTLYRALSWPNYEDYQEYEYDYPMKVGSVFKLSKGNASYSSWTKSLDYAKSFVELTPFGFIVKATIQPKDSILDFDNLPDQIKSKLKHGESEEEVLAKEKNRTVEMVYIYDELNEVNASILLAVLRDIVTP
jgi:stress response protein YsnF